MVGTREKIEKDKTIMLHGNTENDENNPPSPPFSKGEQERLSDIS